MTENANHHSTIIPLFDGDPRYGALIDAIIDTINGRGKGLLFVGVIGALRLVEMRVIENQRNTL